MDYSKLITENRNEVSTDLDIMDTLQAVRLFNQADREVAVAVGKAETEIARVIDHITGAFENGGRLIYCGAGTSGRLGVLDASECFPTFGAGRDMVDARIAGGPAALNTAIEGAEDDPELGVADMKDAGLTGRDVLVAISASGSAAYCNGALKYARDAGAYTACVCCVENPSFAELCDTVISVVVGPEVLTGSTRLRAGTATKMVLNMLTTVSMIKAGKVYKNLMVDMIPTNKKLHDRAVRIIMMATGVTEAEAVKYLDLCGNTKQAIVCILGSMTPQEAEEALERSHGRVREAYEKKSR